MTSCSISSNIFVWNHLSLVESFQLALLGGRILFKNVRYLSTNQSICILKGHLSLRYWLWDVRHEGGKFGTYNLYIQNTLIRLFTIVPIEPGNIKKPCRIVCHLEGLEWFMYNRTPVYYALQEILEMSANMTNGQAEELRSTATTQPLDMESQEADGFSNSLFRRLMPVQIECTRGAIMFGNPDLPTMAVLQFRQASSIYNTDQSRSKLDYYKSSLDLIFREPKISLKHNTDFTVGADDEIPVNRRQSSATS